MVERGRDLVKEKSEPTAQVPFSASFLRKSRNALVEAGRIRVLCVFASVGGGWVWWWGVGSIVGWVGGWGRCCVGVVPESLQVAFGIPVFDDHYLASAVIISSDSAPIARGYEVWRCADDHFLLESKAYQRLQQSLELDDGATLPIEGSLPGLAMKTGVASISEDPEIVFSGRSFRGGDCKGVAIPIYEQERITNILTLLF